MERNDPGVEERIEDLERRINALERLFADKVVSHVQDAQRAHEETKEKNDAREVLEEGSTHEVVVKETPEERDRMDALGYIDGIVTFIDPNGFQIRKYDKVEVMVHHVKKNCAEAGCQAVVERS